jgi:hypothetical protein
MFCLCGSMEYMLWSGFCTLKYGLALAQPNSSSFPYSPTESLAASNTVLNTHLLVWLEGFMGGAEAWAERELACLDTWCSHLPHP